MILKLTAKTHKGKNRIRDHGETWHVLREVDRIIFSPDPGPWAFIAPIGSGDRGSRWINLRSDLDFEIEVLAHDGEQDEAGQSNDP